MVQRVPVASSSSAARRPARSRGASGCGRNSITGGANRTRWTECSEVRVQHRFAPLRHQRDHVAEAGQARAAGGGSGGLAGSGGSRPGSTARGRRRSAAPNGARAVPPATARASSVPRACRRTGAGRRAMAGGWAGGRWRGTAATAATGLRQPRTRSPGVGRSASVAEADQHHLGRGAAVGRGLDLADALQQHLPGAAQRRRWTGGRPGRRRGCARPPAAPCRRARPGTAFSRVSGVGQVQQVLQHQRRGRRPARGRGR